MFRQTLHKIARKRLMNNNNASQSSRKLRTKKMKVWRLVEVSGLRSQRSVTSTKWELLRLKSIKMSLSVEDRLQERLHLILSSPVQSQQGQLNRVMPRKRVAVESMLHHRESESTPWWPYSSRMQRLLPPPATCLRPRNQTNQELIVVVSMRLLSVLESTLWWRCKTLQRYRQAISLRHPSPSADLLSWHYSRITIASS